MKMRIALCISLSLLLSGCINFTSPARSKQLDSTNPYWFDYDASRRGAFFVPESSKFKVCSEPPPDVALSLVSKLEATLKKEGVGEGTGKSEFTTSVVKLAERTQMTSLLRESLYRLCEQSLRHNFTSTEILDAYKKTVDAAADLAKADAAQAEADAAKSKTVQALVEQGKTSSEVQLYLDQQ